LRLFHVAKTKPVYNYILLDLDGTITDSNVGVTKSVQYALKYFDILVEDLSSLYGFIGPPLKESFMKFYDFDDDMATKAAAEFRKYYAVKGICENILYDGMIELLQKLTENNKTIILATAQVTVYAEKILKYFEIDKFFISVCGSELDGRRSNKNEVIQYALEQNDINDLNDVIMVGDREHDIIGAKKNGIASVGVLYGYGDYNELSNAGADYIVNDISGLSGILF
jgi:phosphoglycolate phosphatase